MSEIRGLIFHSRLDYLQKHWNGSSLKKLGESLSLSTRQLISDQIFWVNTYPFEALKEFDLALGRAAGQPEAELYSDIGREFAVALVERYFYNYVEAGAPSKFLLQFQRLYSYLWGFGELEVHLEEQHKAELSFTFDEEIPDSFRFFLEAFLARALEICGAKEVSLNREPDFNTGEDHLVYHLSWR